MQPGRQRLLVGLSGRAAGVAAVLRCPAMKHSVPHDLPLPLAKKAADAALQSYKARFAEYDPQIAWVSERLAEVTFRVKGLSMKGSFEIGDTAIDMDMEVPLLLRPFKNKALEVIEQQITQWIEKARKGELS